MKPISLLIIIASVLTMGRASALGENTNVSLAARELVDQMAKGDFAAAVARFDPTMKAAMPEQKLREVWQSLEAQAGRLKKQAGVRLQTMAGYDIALVTCEFEKITLDAKVVLDGASRVAGLFFQPAQPDNLVAPVASYVRTNAFREEDVTVGTGEWALPGTLTVPVNKRAPTSAIVLVHGSGPNDRDETVGANKPFRDLAWGLATKGITVLRYEKRTKQHAQKFVRAAKLNITVQEETIEDALKAAAQLRQTPGIDPKRVFLLGHSLGAYLAPRIAEGDPRLAGVILLAGPTRPLEDLVVEQTRYLLSLNGEPGDDSRRKLRDLENEIAKIKYLTVADENSDQTILNAPARYWLDLRDYDPVKTGAQLKLPILILQGGRDYQVTVTDYNAWKAALQRHTNVAFKLYPNLNHLMMAGQGKSRPDEYDRAGHVQEAVVADIAAWVLAK